jgi:hypothetical protein
VLHMFGAVLNGSDLWVKCTSSAKLKIHLNVHVLGIGQVTVWSSHVEYGVCRLEFLVMHMVIMVV